MTTVDLRDADLPRLVEALVSGAEDEVTVVRDGKPAVRITPVPPPSEAERPKRRFGFAKGEFEFDYEAFQALDVEVRRLFDEEAKRKRQLYGY